MSISCGGGFCVVICVVTPDLDGCYQAERIRLGTVRSRVAGVLLAAGQGSRFGRPKALVELDGRTLAERGVTMLRAGGADPILIVTGAAQVDLGHLGPDHQARTVYNREWRTGMGSSLRAAF